MPRRDNLERVCRLVRRDVLTISHNAQIGHVGSAFSVVEILVSLYFGVLKIDPKIPNWEERDRFILSKGHAAAAYFSVLCRRGFVSEKQLKTFCMEGSKLMVHPEWNGLAGIEHGTGSLGHGLPVGTGMAYAAKIIGKEYRVFVLISDSEIQEGETWEAAMFAAHHKLDNLTVVVDYNGTQAFGEVKDILGIEPINEKWKAFGFEVSEVDGHDVKKLVAELASHKSKKPRVIIAKTVIGKGVSFMEGDWKWHYYDPKKEHLEKALEELKIK